ncbi:MAG: hypothetical protein SFT68_03970, partial [Rickettsiaceae bacterium]|nr:hypothetical protein [Rickettsiaceae bacterium]
MKKKSNKKNQNNKVYTRTPKIASVSELKYNPRLESYNPIKSQNISDNNAKHEECWHKLNVRKSQDSYIIDKSNLLHIDAKVSSEIDENSALVNQHLALINKVNLVNSIVDSLKFNKNDAAYYRLQYSSCTIENEHEYKCNFASTNHANEKQDIPTSSVWINERFVQQ